MQAAWHLTLQQLSILRHWKSTFLRTTQVRISKGNLLLHALTARDFFRRIHDMGTLPEAFPATIAVTYFEVPNWIYMCLDCLIL